MDTEFPSLYPLFLDLSRKHVLVAGAGDVGERKIASLLTVPVGGITVVDPIPPGPRLAPLISRANVLYLTRPFKESDLSGKSLVFAATPRREVNAQIAALCAERGIWCNIADAPGESDFFVPAHVRQGSVTLAVSTGGGSPALARRIRSELEAWLGNRYTALALLLGRLRPLVLECGLPTEENTRIFRALVHSPLLERLNAGDREAAAEILSSLLPHRLRPVIGELLHDL